MVSPSIILLSMVAGASGLQHSTHGLELKRRGSNQTMAICMSGAARTIVEDRVQKGFNTYVRNSEYAQGLFGAVPDLFMYVRLGDSRSKQMNPRWLDETNRSAVQHAIDVLNATSSKIDESKGMYQEADLQTLGVDPDCFQKKGMMHHPENVARVMNFFEGWYTCHNMVEKWEAKAGKQYDLVMFTRPDVIWKRSLPASWFSAASGYFGIDWWLILPRAISKGMANTLPEYFQTKAPVCCNKNTPELIVFCRARHICEEHSTPCYTVGRGSFDERLLRIDGTEQLSPWWNGPPERFDSSVLMSSWLKDLLDN